MKWLRNAGDTTVDHLGSPSCVGLAREFCIPGIDRIELRLGLAFCLTGGDATPTVGMEWIGPGRGCVAMLGLGCGDGKAPGGGLS